MEEFNAARAHAIAKVQAKVAAELRQAEDDRRLEETLDKIRQEAHRGVFTYTHYGMPSRYLRARLAGLHFSVGHPVMSYSGDVMVIISWHTVPSTSL